MFRVQIVYLLIVAGICELSRKRTKMQDYCQRTILQKEERNTLESYADGQGFFCLLGDPKAPSTTAETAS